MNLINNIIHIFNKEDYMIKGVIIIFLGFTISASVLTIGAWCAHWFIGLIFTVIVIPLNIGLLYMIKSLFE